MSSPFEQNRGRTDKKHSPETLYVTGRSLGGAVSAQTVHREKENSFKFSLYCEFIVKDSPPLSV